MIRLKPLLVLTLVLAVVATGICLKVAAQPTPPEPWKKVEDAVQNRLPKTAIGHLDAIFASALKNKAYPEAIKAICQKIVLESTIEGNKPEEKITRMKSAITAVPTEMRPVLHAVLAVWYWDYFEQNRFRIVGRSTVASTAGDDVTTWDQVRVTAEVERQFEIALGFENELRSIRVGDYGIFLDPGTIDDKYRPTLHDVLAFDALHFYAVCDQASGPRPEGGFELTPDSPIFAPIDDFLKWVPATTDTNSRILKAVRLYQKLLTFHRFDTDKSALLDTDLHRLRLGYNLTNGKQRDAAYIAALKRFVETTPDHELSSMARNQWARALYASEDLVAARDVAKLGMAPFPKSPGGLLCQQLIVGIEAKYSDISTERVWADPMPGIHVHYRNLTKIYCRLVKADFLDRAWRFAAKKNDFDQPTRQALLKLKPTVELAHDLPPTSDFRKRTEIIPAPKGIEPGCYFLITSHTADFGDENNEVSFTEIWVSDLAVVTRTNSSPRRMEGIVVHSKSGEPVEGAKVQIVVIDKEKGATLRDTTTTSQNGMYSLPEEVHGAFSGLLLITHKGQSLAVRHPDLEWPVAAEPPEERTLFFTDRSLYRPGQLVQFKGICIRFDRSNNTYETLPNRDVTVVFAGANDQNIASIRARTNDYGSFSGSFTAPRGQLTGTMSLRLTVGPLGYTSIAVEEYKRPKFTVTMGPSGPAKLNSPVQATGKATAYSGVPIAGAKVVYRVIRNTYDLRWLDEPEDFWEDRGRNAEAITHGVTSTEADGSFVVPFVARPGPSVPRIEKPVFFYTVTAEVTDTSGETRSDVKQIVVGPVALRARVAVKEWQTTATPVDLTIATATLDGLGQASKGVLTIYRLKQPASVVRPGAQDHLADLDPWGEDFRSVYRQIKPPPTWPKQWDIGETVHEQEFKTDGDGKATVKIQLAAGPYRAVVRSKDAFGAPVSGEAELQVLDLAARRLTLPVPNVVTSPSWTVAPGETFTLFWGTGYETGRAFIEIEQRGKVTRAFWTEPGKTQAVVTVPVTADMQGGFTVRTTFIHENRAYLTNHQVDVPWTMKDLTIKWETFRSRLEPGKKETFTAIITGPNARGAVAEMVATVYDQSLDAYSPHGWARKFNVFGKFESTLHSEFNNQGEWLEHVHGSWPQNAPEVSLYYRGLPEGLSWNLDGTEYSGRGGGWISTSSAFGATRSDRRYLDWFPGGFGGLPGGPGNPFFGGGGRGIVGGGGGFGGGGAGIEGDIGFGGRTIGQYAERPKPNLNAVTPRKNLNETAFFFPHLVSNAEGVVRMEFTMPEALTRWKFLGFAHDKELRSGFLTDEFVTAKDLMVQPNPPRFLREGDVIEFPAKVSNTSATRQKGHVRLSLRDARTDAPLDAALGISLPDQTFDLPAGESKTFAWRLVVPEGLGPLTFKAVAASDRYSDGEEGVLPVLARKVLVTESIPLPIRNAGTKEFEFTRLRQSTGSQTIRHQSYTVQMVSQPAWYAVMALPYLMEYPHECSEQTFNRLYANSLARHIAGSDPKIRKIFDLWKGTDALDSPLEKNQDLKGVLLEETPWVRQSVKEGQSRKNVGILFDENRMTEEIARASRKLTDRQQANGMWSWFPGGPPSGYITTYIATGYGRLRHLGVKLDTAPAVKAMAGLDGWADEKYRWVQANGKPDENHLDPSIAMYLYGRSFFLADRPVADAHKQAVDYWLGQSKKHWAKLVSRQSQAHLAIALKRFGDNETPRAIMASIKERSVSNDEMGMFWRDRELQQWWFHAPIETQALMIEAFDEVMNDAQSVEDCKVWLLKQKQAQDWKTTKATADAVYSLLLRGDGLLKSDALVEMTVGNRAIQPQKVEAGTGFYEHRFLGAEVNPSLAAISLKKTDRGVSWGSAHWQYLEDINKVSPADTGPLRVEKRLFKRSLTKAGPVLAPIPGDSLAVGDEVVVRVVIRTDRDMEYVHLKDHRGSGTEPVDVLSEYRFRDGLAYYMSTKDTATHFFIDYLPKGNYVLEYAVRIQHRGKYPTGYANIECMYAPEFNSHSENIDLDVK